VPRAVLTVVLGLASASAYALYDLVMARVSRAIGAVAGLFVTMVVSTVLLTPVALGVDGLPSGGQEWRAVALSAVGGVLYVLSLASLLHGLSIGSLSIVTPLAALEGAFAAVIAISLGESLTPLAGGALVLAVIGAVLASVVPHKSSGADLAEANEHPSRTDRQAMPARRPGARFQWAAGAGWGLLASVFASLQLVVYSRTAAVPRLTAAATGHVAGVLVMIPYVLLRVRLAMPRGIGVRTVLAGVLESVGYVFTVAALTRGPVSIASVMIAQFAVIASILGLVVLRERPRSTQLLGTACTMAAVIILALSL
jgi:drug/metabolite transporter (DMT)-like permease